jgi:hypothetical protein
MTEARKLASRVEAAIKRADPTVIAERIFYDEVSSRLYVTVVKGARKTDMIFPSLLFGGEDQEQIRKVVETTLARLKTTPIG